MVAFVDVPAADRSGRRLVSSIALGLFSLMAFAIDLGSAVATPVFWVPFVLSLTGGGVLMRTDSQARFR